MRFKSEQLREELAGRPTLLLAIVAEFERLSHAEGVDPIVTRVLEVICGSSGVHEAGRAVDFRDEYTPGKFLYSEAARTRVVNGLNAAYPRSDHKPTCLWHSFNGGPHHLHVQMAADAATYVRKDKESNV